jgi:hypothetical protein
MFTTKNKQYSVIKRAFAQYRPITKEDCDTDKLQTEREETSSEANNNRWTHKRTYKNSELFLRSGSDRFIEPDIILTATRILTTRKFWNLLCKSVEGVMVCVARVTRKPRPFPNTERMFRFNQHYRKQESCISFPETMKHLCSCTCCLYLLFCVEMDSL